MRSAPRFSKAAVSTWRSTGTSSRRTSRRRPNPTPKRSSSISAGLEAIAARHEGHEHPVDENLVERRLVLTAAWAPSGRWQLIARLPYSERQLEEGDEKTSSAGLADPEKLLIRWRIWASDFESGLGRANWVSLTFGAKTDWGRDDAREDGELLDQHAQAGTGSTDWLAGVSGVHLLDESSSLYGSLQVRLTGDNDQGYEYGDARLLNVGYERKVAERLDLALEANLRDADADVPGRRRRRPQHRRPDRLPAAALAGPPRPQPGRPPGRPGAGVERPGRRAGRKNGVERRPDLHL